MAGLRRLLATGLMLGGVALGQPSLPCKQELSLTPLGNSPPTDVAVDAAQRIYVLYEGDGYLDVYDKEGRLLEHRGGQAEIRQQLTGVTAMSQWVGRLATSALLVSEVGQQVARGILVPGKHSLEWIPLNGSPEEISGPSALARDLEGNYWVWTQGSNQCRGFNGQGNYIGSRTLPRLLRPLQLAVDSQGALYCLDPNGLHVVGSGGQVRYEVEGAQAFYLTGTDVLAVAGGNWLRQYGPEGQVLSEVREIEPFQEMEPVTLSINDEGQYFVYLKDVNRNTGRILKLNDQGKLLGEFPQPARIPPSPDPGTRLDYQGRLHVWHTRGELLKLHPGGKTERAMRYMPSAEPKGQLVEPADVVAGPDGQMWIADAGNCRLQRFRYGPGWQKPITVGIRGGDPRGMPRSLAFDRFKLLHCVVYPRNKQGEVVLQTRSLDGKLLGQKGVCPAWGDPVVRVSVAPSGELYLYQSRVKTMRGWEEAPQITCFTPRGQVAATAGGDGPGLSAPKNPGRRIVLKPQEDLIAWQGRLLLPTGGSLFMFSSQLEPLREYALQYKTGRNPLFGDFGGACQVGKLLYVIDMGGRCLQRVVLP
jgi:sugar lactone lactonase YvrE